MSVRRNLVALLVTCVAATSIVLASCTPKPVELTAATSGGATQLQVGQKLQITLEANPTTGYSWVDKSDFGDGVLAAIGEPKYTASESGGSSPVVGAGGSTLFVYEAKQAGEAQVKLEYVRPWETGVPATEEFTQLVTVK